MIHTNPNRVLLIGWDAADWKIIHPLIDAGKMPTLEKFISQGVSGNLATLHPDLSPMLWTSIATGKRPFKHGVCGFIEPSPQQGGVRPVTSLSRTTKALWNIFHQTRRRSVVVGWWPSHPAEPINGVMVSNHFQQAKAPPGRPWPVIPGTVHPARLTEILAGLRTHPQDIEVGLLDLFVPCWEEIDQEKDRRLESLAKIIAEATTIKDVSQAILYNEPWDFAAVYFDAIDHFCHGFMQYHPPRLPWTKKEDFELYQLVVESGYRLHDVFLDALLKQAGDEATVILVSDHGFHSDDLRPNAIPDEPAGPAAQHRRFGIFAARGPNIKQDEIVYGASLLDVCPTVLVQADLPVGEDMDGKPLVNIFRQTPAIRSIPSWDETMGDDGRHPPDLQVDPVEAREAVNQLVALGYIEAPHPDQDKAAAEAARELQYNLARSYTDAQRHLEAVAILENLAVNWPDEYRFGVALADGYLALGRTEKARPVLEEILERRQENARLAQQKLPELRVKLNKPDEELSPRERREYRRVLAEATMRPLAVEFLLGSLKFAEGDPEGALEHLSRAQSAETGQPGLFLKLGEVYLEMKRWPEAEKSLESALAADPENPAAYAGLARAYLARRKNKKAAEAALEAVSLAYHNPRAHLLLGMALHRLGRIPRAVEALEMSLAQNPNLPEACLRLAHIYERRIKDPERAAEYRQRAEEAQQRLEDIKAGRIPAAVLKEERARAAKTSDLTLLAAREIAVADEPVDLAETVIIVSGLPRSGTSMMMQILKAGGVKLLVDNVRQADEDNPRGYFEFEPARQLKAQQDWLYEAKGRAVKIVLQLLPHLPADLKYRVIHMDRSLPEVVASQKRMLLRQNRTGADLIDDRLIEVFSRQVKQGRRLLSARRIPSIVVDYGRTVEKTEETAARVNDFLGGGLDVQAMAAAVKPGLYRQRT